MVLKPQDVVVALKLALHLDLTSSYPNLSESLGLSLGEAHKSVQRLAGSRLLDVAKRKPRLAALEEFLIHGVRYAFPAGHKGLTRGMPTAYAAPPLSAHIVAGSEPIPVWPHADGKARGWELTPLYRTVPDACSRDPELYELLALVDGIRAGGARERGLAAQLLSEMLRGLKHQEAA